MAVAQIGNVIEGSVNFEDKTFNLLSKEGRIQGLLQTLDTNNSTIVDLSVPNREGHKVTYKMNVVCRGDKYAYYRSEKANKKGPLRPDTILVYDAFVRFIQGRKEGVPVTEPVRVTQPKPRNEKATVKVLTEEAERRPIKYKHSVKAAAHSNHEKSLKNLQRRCDAFTDMTVKEYEEFFKTYKTSFNLDSIEILSDHDLQYLAIKRYELKASEKAGNSKASLQPDRAFSRETQIRATSVEPTEVIWQEMFKHAKGLTSEIRTCELVDFKNALRDKSEWVAKLFKKYHCGPIIRDVAERVKEYAADRVSKAGTADYNTLFKRAKVLYGSDFHVCSEICFEAVLKSRPDWCQKFILQRGAGDLKKEVIEAVQAEEHRRRPPQTHY